MSVRVRLVLGAALALASAGGEALAQTRPGGAIGYSAAERRIVDQRIANLAAQIERLSSQRVMSPQLVRAIATEVGLANPRFSDAELLNAVEAMSQLAEKLRADNEQMRGELIRLRDPALRDPALALLDEAEAALNDGRLAEAEALFGKIRTLRWDESREADEAWGLAVESEARTAELQQDYIRAQDLRLEASDRLLARAEADHRRAFELADAAAQSRLDEGETFGRAAALDAAILLWRTRVLPLAPRDRYPELWAWAQNNLGNALKTHGERSGGAAGFQLLELAVEAYQAALEVSAGADMPADWALTQNNLGTALQTLGPRIGGAEGLALLADAVSAYRAALEVLSRADTPFFGQGLISTSRACRNRAAIFLTGSRRPIIGVRPKRR
ncbi:MAG: hypothetical protein ACKO1O_13375 [Erythrobacter sp.]